MVRRQVSVQGFCRSPDDLIDDRGHIHPVVQGLPDPSVGERTFQGVRHEDDGEATIPGMAHGAAVGLEGTPTLDADSRRQVRLAGQDGFKPFL